MIAKHQIEKLENCHKYLESKNSSTDFSVLKLAEELTELSSVLIKYSNKPTKREALEKNIAEEMGDVYVRLIMASKYFGNDKDVAQRIEKKIHKLCTGRIR